MLFRQFFDPVSSTYTYLLAERRGGEYKTAFVPAATGFLDRLVDGTRQYSLMKADTNAQRRKAV